MKSVIDWSGWDEIESRLLKLETVEVEAGYITPTPHKHSNLTLPEIAAIQQYGSISRNIPERPFMTDGAELSKKKVHTEMSKAVVKYLTNKTANKKVFKPVADAMKEGIEDALLHGRFTPLSKTTIDIRRNKGRNGTDILIDTGQLLDGVETNIK